MYVKPAPLATLKDPDVRKHHESAGRKAVYVRDPDLKDHLPEEGREVPDDHPYWHRRLRDGDVVEAERPQEPEPEAAPETPPADAS